MEKEENMDYTEELVTPVGEYPQPENKQNYETTDEVEQVRSASVLMNVPYNEMTYAEKEYFISALKVRNQELDNLAKKAFEENRKINEARNRDLRLMEDTLTFIKTSVGNCLGSVTLAIKNMEREVRGNGN